MWEGERGVLVGRSGKQNTSPPPTLPEISSARGWVHREPAGGRGRAEAGGVCPQSLSITTRASKRAVGRSPPSAPLLPLCAPGCSPVGGGGGHGGVAIAGLGAAQPPHTHEQKRKPFFLALSLHSLRFLARTKGDSNSYRTPTLSTPRDPHPAVRAIVLRPLFSSWSRLKRGGLLRTTHLVCAGAPSFLSRPLRRAPCLLDKPELSLVLRVGISDTRAGVCFRGSRVG